MVRLAHSNDGAIAEQEGLFGPKRVIGITIVRPDVKLCIVHGEIVSVVHNVK